jgi:hypothetical protein
MDSQTEFIRDFEITFIRDDEGRFNVSNTSQVTEWYTKHIATLSCFEGVRKPASPQFLKNQKQNEDTVRGLYLFGIRYYNELIEKRDNL